MGPSRQEEQGKALLKKSMLVSQPGRVVEFAVEITAQHGVASALRCGKLTDIHLHHWTGLPLTHRVCWRPCAEVTNTVCTPLLWSLHSSGRGRQNCKQVN